MVQPDRRRFGTRIAISAIVAAGIASGVFASSASALTELSQSKAIGAGTQSGVEVECPLGEKVLGGGTTAGGGFNAGYLNSTGPSDGQDGNSKSDDAWIGFVDSNGSTAFTKAVCVGGKVAAKSKVREETEKIKPGDRKSLVVSCPDGYHVSGGGVFNPAGYGELEVRATRPTAGNTAWKGTLNNFSTTKSSINVHAICVRGGFANKLKYRSKDDKATPGAQKTAVAPCPGSGRTPIGGGTAIEGGRPANLNSTLPEFLSNLWFATVDALGAKSVKFTGFVICR